jgi:hypothetical protein
MYIKPIEKVGIIDPRLEAAYWFAEGVLPILERRGWWRHPAPGRVAGQTHPPFAPANVQPGSHVEPSTRETAAS